MPAIIGLFAFAQGLELCLGEAHATIAGTKRLSWNIWPKFSEIWHIRWSLSRGWACGLVLGIIPAAGASVAQWIAYAWEIRRGKPGDGFGKGEIKGLAATEGSNNSATGTSLIPMFVLGIPGGISAAVILGALVVHGLQPGMRLFETNPDVVYTVIWGFILANIMMGVIAVFLARAMAYLTVFPSGILAPMILIFCVIGTYTNTNNLFDVWLMIGFGVLGYFMYKYRFSPAGLLLGLILGPIAENGLRDLMVVSHCNPIAFTLGRPISLATWPRPYWCCSTPSVSAHGEEQRERDVESVTAGTDGKASPPERAARLAPRRWTQSRSPHDWCWNGPLGPAVAARASVHHFRVRSQTRALDADDRKALVVRTAVSADADSPHDLAILRTDEDASRIGQQASPGRNGKRRDEVGVVFGLLGQRAAGFAHRDSAPGLADRDVGPEHARAVLALERLEVAALVQDGDRKRLRPGVPALPKDPVDDRICLSQGQPGHDSSSREGRSHSIGGHGGRPNFILRGRRSSSPF